ASSSISRAHRAAAGLASDHQLLAFRQHFLRDLDEIGIQLHLARSLDENHRDIDRASGVAQRKLTLGANIDIDRIGVLLQCFEGLGRLLFFYRHRMSPLFGFALQFYQITASRLTTAWDCRSARSEPCLSSV